MGVLATNHSAKRHSCVAGPRCICPAVFACWLRTDVLRALFATPAAAAGKKESDSTRSPEEKKKVVWASQYSKFKRDQAEGKGKKK